ncbi:MAG: ATP synthase F1 subunit epsilon [Lachnospiraceae bacterium]|nr:ATP synthase F1 subunit epsilon [Lachnospiraceae bacterium]
MTSMNGTFFNGKVEEATLPLADGEMGILAHHDEAAIAIVPGEISIRTPDGQTRVWVVSEGFANVANNRMKVIVYSAEKPEEVDINSAMEEEERAIEEMRQQKNREEYRSAQISLARAMARLAGAKKYKSLGD